MSCRFPNLTWKLKLLELTSFRWEDHNWVMWFDMTSLCCYNINWLLIIETSCNTTRRVMPHLDMLFTILSRRIERMELEFQIKFAGLVFQCNSEIMLKMTQVITHKYITPLVIKHSWTGWVGGSYWPHLQKTIADWSTLFREGNPSIITSLPATQWVQEFESIWMGHTVTTFLGFSMYFYMYELQQ